MIRVRYTAWDGSQRVRLSAERVFESFAGHLADTDDAAKALEWLLRRGLDWDDVRIVGLDELLEHVREALRERFAGHTLEQATAAIREQLDALLALERDALARDGDDDAERRARKRALLASLPARLSAAIERLRDYAFESEEAAGAFGNLLERLERLRAFEQFAQRFGDRFRGSHALDFEGAVRLMQEIERLKGLEEQLLGGDLENLDIDLVRELLGVEAGQHVGTLREMLALLTSSGYLTAREGAVRLSAKGIRRIGQLALRDIYQNLLRDRVGSHRLERPGTAESRRDTTKTYRYGDAFDLDVVETLKHGLLRAPTRPLALAPADFAVFEADRSTTTSTVFLLDMSWSMSWDGRFAAAKKVALAMESLIRARYPRDFFAIVGFFTRAVELKAADLPEASWNMGDPFTNLQDGLRLAARILGRHRSSNRHIILITDGQPTAYFHGGRLYCEWPLSFGGISVRAARETLTEVERVTRQGIVINTFMLDDSPALRAFVDRMTRINRGRAFYTRPDRLGEYLLVDYVARKRRRV
jgi:uncharacterized protein with von Willebrand factor type A (vWA) domain